MNIIKEFDLNNLSGSLMDFVIEINSWDSDNAPFLDYKLFIFDAMYHVRGFKTEVIY